MKLALAFLAAAVLMIPVWILTGCAQNGLWLLGILFAIVGLFGFVAERTPPSTGPADLGRLDLMDRGIEGRKQPWPSPTSSRP
jgi:hypothetical protein